MNTSSTTANPRLAFCMKPELKDRIEEAAALLGLNLTDFVLSSLPERASEVVERHRNITLSGRDPAHSARVCTPTVSSLMKR